MSDDDNDELNDDCSTTRLLGDGHFDDTDADNYRQLKVLTAMRQSRTDDQSFDGRSERSVDGQSQRSVGLPHVDPDYTSQSTGVCSYLDPNYMPAV